MDTIRLITPVEGQKNWGNAINRNFQYLLTKYSSVLTEYNHLKSLLEELETLKISKTQFIYITSDGAYLNGIEDWDSPHSIGEIDFTNPIYKNYDAWFVQTPNDEGIPYDPNALTSNIMWHTGDLLILYKNNANAFSTEQWTGIMGGYYRPVETIIEGVNLQTLYKKTPAFSANLEEQISSPLIHWKPKKYENGIFTYAAYYDGTTEITSLGTQPFEIGITTKATVNYRSIENIRESDSSIDITFKNVVPSNVGMQNIGYTISFTDVDNNILYFRHNLKKDDTDLKLTIYPNKYNATLRVKLSVFMAEA